ASERGDVRSLKSQANSQSAQGQQEDDVRNRCRALNQRQLPGVDTQHDESGHHDEAWTNFVVQPPRCRRGKSRGGRYSQQDDACVQRSAPAEGLQIDRHQKLRAEQSHRRDIANQRGIQKGRVREESQIHHRLFGHIQLDQRVDNQHQNAEAEEHQGRGTGPAIILRNRGGVQHGTKTGHGCDQPKRIEARPTFDAVIQQKARAEEHAEDSNRHIDEEDRPPDIQVYQPTAEDRSQRGRNDQRDTEDAERPALLFWWKGAEELRGSKRLRNSAAESLQGTRRDQKSKRGSEAAQERPQGEQPKSKQIHAFDPETIRKKT